MKRGPSLIMKKLPCKTTSIQSVIHIDCDKKNASILTLSQVLVQFPMKMNRLDLTYVRRHRIQFAFVKLNKVGEIESERELQLIIIE